MENKLTVGQLQDWLDKMIREGQIKRSTEVWINRDHQVPEFMVGHNDAHQHPNTVEILES